MCAISLAEASQNPQPPPQLEPQANAFTTIPLKEAIAENLEARADGTYEDIQTNEKITATIAATGNKEITYNTYTINVPEGIAQLVLQLESHAPLGLVVQYDSIPTKYSQADFNSFTRAQAPPRYVLELPKAGIYYADVVNLQNRNHIYTLRATAIKGTKRKTTNANTYQETIPTEQQSGVIPKVIDFTSLITEAKEPHPPIIQKVQGTLAGKTAVATFHTYVLELPEGSHQLSIILRCINRELDLALKAGEPIVSYQNNPEVKFDNSLQCKKTMTVVEPQAGKLYVDVVNGYGTAGNSNRPVVSSYTLEMILE